MHRYLLTTILAMLLSVGAWSQEAETRTEPGADAAEPGVEASAVEPATGDEVEEQIDEQIDEEIDEEIDDSDLDETSYADTEEEDFVPTEDIPTDQAIPFPTDI